MSLTITDEDKNSLTITDEDKPTNGTWADYPIPWSDMSTTWGQPGTAIANESKNNLSITNESKN